MNWSLPRLQMLFSVARASACFLFPLIAVMPTASAVSVGDVVVVSDGNQPLEADVQLIPATVGAKPETLGHTSLPKGELIVNPARLCKQGERLYAYVEAGPYLGRRAQCKTRTRIVLSSWETVVAELRISRAAQQGKKSGLAALVLFDVAARLRAAPTVELMRTKRSLASAMTSPVGPKVALNLRTLDSTITRELAARRSSAEQAHKDTPSHKAWVNAGEFLGVESPASFDASTSSFIMRPTTREAIIEYQADHGLVPSGQLNYVTLRDFAHGDLGSFVTKRVLQQSRAQ